MHAGGTLRFLLAASLLTVVDHVLEKPVE